MPTRRQLVTGVALATLGIAGAVASRVLGLRDEEAARARLTAAREAMRDARLDDARRDAGEAVGLAPGPDVLAVWVDANASWLLDGDGGVADGVALVERARVGGARGTTLATALAAAAVATRNDRHALAVAEMHERAGHEGAGVFELVQGACFELACDDRADAAYERSLQRWPGALLPRLRRARSAIFSEQWERADEVLGELPGDLPAARVLDAVGQLLRSSSRRPPPLPSLDASTLPRSVRPLAAALRLTPSAPGVGIEAALDDADGPRALELCARIALALGDPDSAQRAVDAALRARPELASAQRLAERVAESRRGASP